MFSARVYFTGRQLLAQAHAVGDADVLAVVGDVGVAAFLVEADGFGLLLAGFEYGGGVAQLGGPALQLGQHQPGNALPPPGLGHEHALDLHLRRAVFLEGPTAHALPLRVGHHHVPDGIDLVELGVVGVVGPVAHGQVVVEQGYQGAEVGVVGRSAGQRNHSGAGFRAQDRQKSGPPQRGGWGGPGRSFRLIALRHEPSGSNKYKILSKHQCVTLVTIRRQ